MTSHTNKRTYVPAIGTKLKRLLYVVFGLLSLLVANSLYLGTITFLEWQRGETYQNQFYMAMFLGHVVLGFLFVVPFLLFGIIHLVTARKRKNKRAIRVGYALFALSLVVLISGILLVRIGDLFDLKQPTSRSIVYWLHVLSPFAVVWLYWLHRLVGQKIKWKLGIAYGVIAVGSVAAMVSMHVQDPRDWNVVGSSEGSSTLNPRWLERPTEPLSRQKFSITMNTASLAMKMPTSIGAIVPIVSARSTTQPIWRASGKHARSP